MLAPMKNTTNTTSSERRNFAMFQVRVSAREKALFAQAAAAARKSMATWARDHLEAAALQDLRSAPRPG
jgi:predicted HicB family RNase H-like nuclease